MRFLAEKWTSPQLGRERLPFAEERQRKAGRPSLIPGKALMGGAIGAWCCAHLPAKESRHVAGSRITDGAGDAVNGVIGGGQ